jgi:hypothetical protein
MAAFVRPAGTGGHTGAPTGPQRRLYGPGSSRESGPPVGRKSIRRATDSLAGGAAGASDALPRTCLTGRPPNLWRTRTAAEQYAPSAPSQPADQMPLALADLDACYRCHQRGRCSGGGSLTPRWRRASRMAIQPRAAEPWSCHSPAIRRSWRSSRRRRRVVIPAWCHRWSSFVACAFSQP